MSLTASGFVVFLLSVQVIKGQHGWGVTYSPAVICGSEGSTVNIRCSYTYPSRWKDSDTRVEKTFWFTKMKGGQHVDLMTDSEYSGRVNYSCNEKICTLTITNLTESDSAEYKFRFMSSQPGGKYTGQPGVTVSVTGPGLTVQMKGSSSNWLECHNICPLPDRPSYIWYKNGQEVQAETSSSYSGFSYEDSYSCAVKGSEDFPSPPVLIKGQDGWGVTYSPTKICALKGSTVNIRGSYTYPSRWKDSDARVEKTFWFTKMKDGEPVDLMTESEYSGRVNYSCNEKICTLTITNLTESDSAEYKFRFMSSQPGGKYTGQPGVTVSVTGPGLTVQMKGSSSNWLECHNICPLPDRPSYIWYKNGQEVQAETSSSYSGFSYEDSYSCAVKGSEDFPSPPVLIKGQDGWGVTYSPTKICALKGSTVNIRGSYTYPSRWKDSDARVEKTFWFTKMKDGEPVDLMTESEYSGRVNYSCNEKICTLTITNLTESDSAEYKFRFMSSQPGWKYTGEPGVTVSVTGPGLTVQMKGSSSNWLECHSSCLLPDRPSYIWYKNGREVQAETSSSYSGFSYEDSYSCAVKGSEDFPSPPVYGPRLPSVSVSSSGEIVEGSSVTLTCSSDANPAANYTWYKENGNLKPLSEQHQLVFSSIQSSDSGQYNCTAENQLGRTSGYISVDVKYGPKLPSVSVSPSGEIVEGSSVTLTCSSDANPAANYTWYKENEDSPKASGQIFTITNLSAEHSGNYYCEAQNNRGRHNSTLHLTVVVDKSTMIIMITGLILVVIIPIPLILFSLWMRKRNSLSSTTEPHEPADTVELDSDAFYANISDAVYANISDAGREQK